MRTPLVIIDVQNGFYGSDDPVLLKNIIREIRLAKKRESHVYLVEYEDEGRTLIELRRLLTGYRKTHILTKDDDDGSSWLLEAFSKLAEIPEKIRVCGLYTTCCVAETITGLVIKQPGMIIEVIKDACLDGLRVKVGVGVRSLKRQVSRLSQNKHSNLVIRNT